MHGDHFEKSTSNLSSIKSILYWFRDLYCSMLLLKLFTWKRLQLMLCCLLFTKSDYIFTCIGTRSRLTATQPSRLVFAEAPNCCEPFLITMEVGPSVFWNKKMLFVKLLSLRFCSPYRDTRSWQWKSRSSLRSSTSSSLLSSLLSWVASLGGGSTPRWIFLF